MKTHPKFSGFLGRITLLVVLGTLFTGCASQKDVIILDERLMLLERQNQELQRQNSEMQKLVKQELAAVGESSQTAETALRSNYASMNAQINTLQEETRRLAGRMEEFEYQLNQKLANVENSRQKVDELGAQSAQSANRLSEIEKYLNLGESGKPISSAKPSGGEAAASAARGTTEEQLYIEAKQNFDNGNLEKARQGFQQLLKSFPKSVNADNAQFWVGESYYREKWYEKAILEYQTVIEKYPNGNKVPAAMLKQGMAFLELGDKSNARLILKEVEKKFPQSNEAKVAAKKLTEF